jgi:hypothetical protein
MPRDTSETVSRTAGRVLNDDNASKDAKSLAGSALSQAKGISKPFTLKEAREIDGVDEETRLFHGIDPETKERVSVTIEGLKAEFGPKEGERKYLEIAGIAGGSVFFNPHTEATSFRPPLGISALYRDLDDLTDQYGAEQGQVKFEANKKLAAKVEEILASTEE